MMGFSRIICATYPTIIESITAVIINESVKSEVNPTEKAIFAITGNVKKWIKYREY